MTIEAAQCLLRLLNTLISRIESTNVDSICVVTTEATAVGREKGAGYTSPRRSAPVTDTLNTTERAFA